MRDTLELYTSDVDRLLAEICLTGAMYGLERQVAVIVQHLASQPRTQGPARLAHALAKTVVRDFDGAVALAEQVLRDPEASQFHGEAAAFQRMANQLKSGAEVQPLDPAQTGR